MIEELEEDIADEVLAAARPTVILAYTVACGACYQVGQVLALLSEHQPGVDFYRLDVGAAPALSARLAVDAAPSLLLRFHDTELRRLRGSIAAADIAAVCREAAALQGVAPSVG